MRDRGDRQDWSPRAQKRPLDCARCDRELSSATPTSYERLASPLAGLKPCATSTVKAEALRTYSGAKALRTTAGVARRFCCGARLQPCDSRSSMSIRRMIPARMRAMRFDWSKALCLTLLGASIAALAEW